MVDSSLFVHPVLVDLPTSARLMFCGMITLADDAGRVVADPEALRLQVLPRSRVSSSAIRAWLGALEAAGILRLFTHQARQYAELTGFKRHQQLKRPRDSARKSDVALEAERVQARLTTAESARDRAGVVQASEALQAAGIFSLSDALREAGGAG